MRKLSKGQERRLNEIEERNNHINGIVLERIQSEDAPLPLNLILEARFNELTKAGINLEGELEYLKKDTTEGVDKQFEIKSQRLVMVKAQLSELQRIGDLMKKYDSLGREIEIVQ